MWRNADENGMYYATVFMQDRLVAWNSSRTRMTYRIPRTVPSFSPGFDGFSYHMQALYYFEEERDTGEFRVQAQIFMGRRPYMSQEANPMPKIGRAHV